MGIIGSRPSKKHKQQQHINVVQQDEKEEDMELQLLRRAIKNNPNHFVLNNLMMCIQFFGNFEEQIEHIRETMQYPREVELNKRLSPHQKRVLLPNVLQEEVAKNVNFTSIRQTIRLTTEPLQPVRIYVAHNNIEVLDQNDLQHYSTMNDGTTCNVLLKASENEGYVTLQLLDETQLKVEGSQEEGDLSSIIEDGDELYTDSDSVYGPKPNLSSRYGRNRQRDLKRNHSRSLPDLCHEDNYFADEGRALSRKNYESRSVHEIKAESDYEHISPNEERLYKGQKGVSSRYRSNQRIARNQQARSKMYSSRSPASSTSSGYKSNNYMMDSDSDYGYTTHSRRRSSNDGKSSENSYSSDKSVTSSGIPRRCFKKVTYTKDGKIYDPREEKRQLLNSKQRMIRTILKRYNFNIYYLSSSEFMKNFVDVFMDKIADTLDFDLESKQEAKAEGSVIYCNKVEVSNVSRWDTVDPYEIIPAVRSQWPHCANEWLNRPRATWPSYDEIGKIKDFGCYVVPEGYEPKNSVNRFQDLEWQLAFPAAERYLETCMTAAQAHVYLMSLMLHKTFIRPVFDTMYSLTTAHIRNQFFWMLEMNAGSSKWPDNRTGECLIKLLYSLYGCISQNEPILSDYFIPDKNLFERVPSEHLLHTQKQLKRIIENPIMYVFHAMENVKYTQQFFPKIDFEMLLKILTINTLALVNPALVEEVPRPIPKSIMKEKGKEAYCIEDTKYRKPVLAEHVVGGFWVNAKNTSKTQEKEKIYATRPIVTSKTLINPRKTTDSIIEISVHCEELEGPRLSALLDFFVSHFIKMAERCHQYQAQKQKTIYLDQADRLAIILSDFNRWKQDAREYRDKIKGLRKRTAVFHNDQPPPITPKKNVEAPIFVAPLKDRFNPEFLDHSSRNKEYEVLDNRMDVTRVGPSSVPEKFIERELPRPPSTSSIRSPSSMNGTTKSKHKRSSDRISSQVMKDSITTSPLPPSPTGKNSLSRAPSSKTKSSTPVEETSSSEKILSSDDKSKRNLQVTPKHEEENATLKVVSLVENHDESFLTETTYI